MLPCLRGVVLALLLGSISSAALAMTMPVWTFEDVYHSASNYGFDISLALDNAGSPHIAFPQELDNSLRYASRVNGTWQTQTIVPSGVRYQPTSLAFDSQGRPRILNATTTSTTQLTTWDGTTWSSQVIPSSSGWGDLRIDALDRSQVAYINPGATALRYAVGDGSSWTSSIIESGHGPYSRPAIAIGKDGNPRVAYWSTVGTKLNYAVWTGSSWSISTVDQIDPFFPGSGDISLALDANDNPSIVYHPYYGLKYATLVGGVWVRQSIPTVGTYNAGYNNTLAFLPEGNPIVLFSDNNNATGEVFQKFGVREGGMWQIQTVVAGYSGNGPGGATMILGNNSIQIAYQLHSFNDNTSVLRYGSAALPVPEPLTAGLSLLALSALGVALARRPRVE